MSDDFNLLPKMRTCLLQIGEELRNKAYEHAPKRSTDLARSIVVSDFDATRLQVTVGPTVGYGLFVHEGWGLWGPKKRKYKILPRRKKALWFNSRAGAAFSNIRSRKVHYTTGREGGVEKSIIATHKRVSSNDTVVASVMHPGAPGQPFLDEAWDEIADWAAQKIAEDVSAEIAANLNRIKRL